MTLDFLIDESIERDIDFYQECHENPQLPEQLEFDDEESDS